MKLGPENEISRRASSPASHRSGRRDFQGRLPVPGERGADPPPPAWAEGPRQRRKGESPSLADAPLGPGGDRDAAPSELLPLSRPVPPEARALMISLALNHCFPLFESLYFAAGRYSHAQHTLR